MTTLVAPREGLAYFDRQAVPLPCPMSPLAAWNAIMADPLPGMALAFRIRDAISARFGVARIGGFSGQRVTQVAPGDRLDFFLVEGSTEHELVLTARDRHLDVMISIETMGETLGRQLSITASVITHNTFGRAYMIPVAPAHRLIVRLMLKRLQRRLQAGAGLAPGA
ncbi:DUF2867 domain-containing protein [Gemmobacter serpentinus]|uniref:DUF2867 domain-containing protein n=1 Tax=Gemmobacter serpentinus TaxID=2652247 RepID=UPI00124C14F1|nr:DUF2867 domain-containing protein [Gemmobacter serpentinus]